MLKDLASSPYVPLLAVRPAEMTALQELPEKSKDLLFPCVLLRPWVSALQFDA